VVNLLSSNRTRAIRAILETQMVPVVCLSQNTMALVHGKRQLARRSANNYMMFMSCFVIIQIMYH
jgi:hypothetical protein